MQADVRKTRRWDRGCRIGAAPRVRLCDVCREAPCRTQAHPRVLRASACICVESCFLWRVPHWRHPGEALHRGMAMGPHGAWAVAIAAAIGVLCRMIDELVHGVLTALAWVTCCRPVTGQVLLTLHRVLPPGRAMAGVPAHADLEHAHIAATATMREAAARLASPRPGQCSPSRFRQYRQDRPRPSDHDGYLAPHCRIECKSALLRLASEAPWSGQG